MEIPTIEVPNEEQKRALKAHKIYHYSDSSSQNNFIVFIPTYQLYELTEEEIKIIEGNG